MLNKPLNEYERPDLRLEFEAWMQATGIKTKAEACRRLQVSYNTLPVILAGKSTAKMPRLRMLSVMLGAKEARTWNDTPQDWSSIGGMLSQEGEITPCQTL